MTAAIVDLHRGLHRFADLQPGPEVNALFSTLVRLVVEAPGDVASAALRDPDVRDVTANLRLLCADGELALEHEWSRRIAAHMRPETELQRFPYLNNYAQLTRMELGMLASVLRGTPATIAFLGCGPLPLTAIQLARQLGSHIRVVDRDGNALAAATRVLEALDIGIPTALRADAVDYDASDDDVVVLAAMAGASAEEKNRILRHLSESMKPGAILVVRSTKGLRTLLYAPVADDDLAGFDVLSVVHPVNDVINSVIVGRARG